MEWRKPVVYLPAAFLSVLGLAWLLGTVRAGILAQPETNWPLELLKIFGTPILTGVFLLFGANVAYRYANRGRKEDILYKERYKSFEEVAAFLYEIVRRFEKLHGHHQGTHKLFVSKFVDDRSEAGRIATEILAGQPNRRHLVLFQPRTQASYYGTIHLLEQLIQSVDDKGDESIVKAYYDYVERAIEYRGYFQNSLGSIISVATETLTLAEADIDLPRK